MLFYMVSTSNTKSMKPKEEKGNILQRKATTKLNEIPMIYLFTTLNSGNGRPRNLGGSLINEYMIRRCIISSITLFQNLVSGVAKHKLSTIRWFHKDLRLVVDHCTTNHLMISAPAKWRWKGSEYPDREWQRPRYNHHMWSAWSSCQCRKRCIHRRPVH